MKQQTAMQELIDYLKELDSHIGHKTTYTDGLHASINKAQQLLEKEKEQIMNDYKNGFEDGCNMTQEFNVLYFEETYKQN